MAFKDKQFHLASLILLLCLASIPLSADEQDITGSIETVERIRELRFTGPVRQTTITRVQLRKHLEGLLRSDLPVAPADYFRALHALRLIPDTVNAQSALLDFYESQVLAFYDPKNATYYSLDERPAGIPAAAILDAGVAIHELTHALQDQAFNVGETFEALRDDMDGQMAYQAVIEGEAMLVMLAAMAEMGGASLDALVESETVAGLVAAATGAGVAAPEGVPQFFVESAKFPYFTGLQFVIEAYRRGGWPKVNELHRRRPASTEQLIHPELYFDDAPRGMAGEPKITTASDRKLFDAEVGEFGWRFLLGEKAAEGWGGDSVRFISGKELTVLVITTWDSADDAREFEMAYRSFLETQGIRGEVVNKGLVVRAAYGPDTAAVASFLEKPVKRAVRR